MEEEYLEKLEFIKNELEIPEDDFQRIIELAIKRKETSKVYISDATLFEIIVVALSNYDYEDIDRYTDTNTSKDGIMMLLTEARDEFSDEERVNLFNDLQNIKETERYRSEEGLPSQRKSLEEIVERSAKSLGL